MALERCCFSGTARKDLGLQRNELVATWPLRNMAKRVGFQQPTVNSVITE